MTVKFKTKRRIVRDLGRFLNKPIDEIPKSLLEKTQRRLQHCKHMLDPLLVDEVVAKVVAVSFWIDAHSGTGLSPTGRAGEFYGPTGKVKLKEWRQDDLWK